MTREEFGKLILQCRQESGMKMMDICVALSVMPQAVYRVESGKFNTNMPFIFQLLKALDYKLLVDGKPMMTAKALVKWMKAGREGRYTQQEIADKLGLNRASISNIETEQSAMMLDSFLGLAELYNSKITFKHVSK